ncbi:MAG: GTPase ObgE [Candidatus Ozemobacteraceae bacterium]
MKFIDFLTIEVASGKGGDGLVAFRHEKFTPMGGPSGGDGGRGGSVSLVATRDYTTLYELSFRRLYDAKSGQKGGPKDMFGKDAESRDVPVPVGTLVYDDDTGELIADLDHEAARIVVAKGGRGGKGNAKFVSSVRRAPRIAEKGEPGERRKLRLELKLLADVGLVGLPNAGKSTLLSVASNARPKIADYPFTTLVPILGIVKSESQPSFCIADLPGLIEGAHEGAGLGVQFLKHVERTRVLIHLVDVSTLPEDNMLQPFDTILEELRSYNPALLEKPMLVAGNKLDLTHAREVWPVFVRKMKRRGYKVFPLSGITREGLDDLLKAVAKTLAETTPVDAAVPMQPEKSHVFIPAFEIEQENKGVWRVQGREIERLTSMIDFTTDEGVAMYLKKLKKMGFLDELGDIEADDEDTIIIGDMEFSYREFFR